MPDMVNHPPHYTAHPKGIECIDVIEDSPSYNLGTAIKYIWRVNWGGKDNDLQDLMKAKWYLEREIAKRKHAWEEELMDSDTSRTTKG